MIIDPALERPLPQLGDAPSREYFRAWADQRFLVQRCTACGHRQHYPRALCEECGGEPEFLEHEARGTVYTYTVIRQMGVEPFRSEAPYVVAMIEVADGIKVMGNITHCEIDDVRIGMPVRGYAVVFGEIGVPYWRPDENTAETQERGEN